MSPKLEEEFYSFENRLLKLTDRMRYYGEKTDLEEIEFLLSEIRRIQKQNQSLG